mgnify:CR=1 FL=1
MPLRKKIRASLALETRIHVLDMVCSVCDKGSFSVGRGKGCGKNGQTGGGESGCEPDVLAFLKLRIIVKALNEGWEPRFTEDECRYYPWFILYTGEEYNKLDEEEKSRVVYRSNIYAGALGGVSYAVASVDSSVTGANIGVRLAFKTSELAAYCGRQFLDIWADFVFLPEKKSE